MQPYSDSEIEEAIERIAADVTRRLPQLDFPGAAMGAFVGQLRLLQAARRGNDLIAARVFAATLEPAFEGYRPTNSTSRAKAILSEVVAELLAADSIVPPG